MGNNTSKSEIEKYINECEGTLNLNKYTIPQIKNAFFFLNKDNSIVLEKIEKGLIQLGVILSEEQKEKILYVFLKAFLIEKIEVNSKIEYDFRDLMGIFFILSKSSEEEKLSSLYKLYDYSNNNSLSKSEIEHMFSQILIKTNNYSKELYIAFKNIENLETSKELSRISIENSNIEKATIKTINYLLDADLSKSLTQTQFIEKMTNCKDKIKYNYLNSTGIREIFGFSDYEGN